ncbi:hypothetical protein GGF31_004697 [Allomyces arbusculus]|nr:hypothetical protein GGF31_004697 [Allomyces arbusculus]
MSTTPNRAPPPAGSATSPRLSPTQFRARKQFWESVATTAEHEVQDALSVSSTPQPPRARSRRSAPAGWNYLQPDGTKRHEEQEVALYGDVREDGVRGLAAATAATAAIEPSGAAEPMNLVAEHDTDHVVPPTTITAQPAPAPTQKRRRSVTPAGAAAATPVRRSARIVAKAESTPSTLPETPTAAVRAPPRRKASISPAGRSRVRVKAAAAALESSPAGNTRGRSRSRKRSAPSTTPASLSPNSFKRRRATFESTDADPTPLPPAKRARRSAPAAIADADTSLFATRAAVPCAACARDVYRREAVVLGGTRAWHPACFVCADCRAKAGEGNTPARLATALAVVVEEGVLVCAHHAMDRMRRTVPATAKAEVSGSGSRA